jgi:hypothetical protein
MSGYLSGAEVLADARLRLSGLPPDQGLLILEGRDDVRLFLSRSVGSQSLLACGKKRTLLHAHELLRPGENARIVFVTDCDYDVAVGRLTPQQNLIVTQLVDVEADLIDLGTLQAVVVELVPRAITSADQLNEITAAVVTRAGAVAETIGRFRLVCAEQNLGLAFDHIKLRRYRRVGSSQVDVAKLAHSVVATNEDCPLTRDELMGEARRVPGGAKLRHGKDWLRATAVVLHQDFGVPIARLAELESMLRLALSDVGFAGWEVVKRVRRWEETTGRRVLLPHAM